MGRTIKISELKKFDVFKWEEYLDERLVSMDAERFDSLDNDRDNYFFLKDMDKEVELLGRMEFKEEQPPAVITRILFPQSNQQWNNENNQGAQ